MPGNVVAVSSGKGGVGKTSLTVNLAVALAGRGKKVLVCDADLGLANVDITLGLKPQYDLQHVLAGERTLDEIVIEGPQGVGVIPAASGIARMLELSAAERLEMGLAFTALSERYDLVLLDTAAGIGQDVISFLSGANHVIVVVCDEPTSLTDAYALIKVSASERKVRRFQIVANKVKGSAHGLQVYKKLLNATDQFLDVNLSYLGDRTRHLPQLCLNRSGKPVIPAQLIQNTAADADRSIGLKSSALLWIIRLTGIEKPNQARLHQVI